MAVMTGAGLSAIDPEVPTVADLSWRSWSSEVRSFRDWAAWAAGAGVGDGLEHRAGVGMQMLGVALCRGQNVSGCVRKNLQFSLPGWIFGLYACQKVYF